MLLGCIFPEESTYKNLKIERGHDVDIVVTGGACDDKVGIMAILVC